MKKLLIIIFLSSVFQFAHAQMTINFDVTKHYGDNFLNTYGGFTYGDINGDNNNDLIISSLNYVSILTSSGAGGLIFSKNVYVGSTPSGIVTADINADGKNDIIVANQSDNSVTILYNSVAGDFSSRLDFNVGPNPTALAIGDWQNDGKKDLAVLNHGNSSIYIFTGTGTGTFVKTSTITFPGVDLVGLQTADIDGDARPDLICVDKPSNTATFLLNNGTGKFTATSNFTVTGSPSSFRLTDINGDLKSDLAVYNGNDIISLYYNYSGAAFQSMKLITVPGGGTGSFDLADLNNDNKPELIKVTANSLDNGSVVYVLTQTGILNFSLSGVYYSNYLIDQVNVSDLNNDGFKDINCMYSSKHISFMNTGNGLFAQENFVDLGTFSDLRTIDLNQDGREDFINFQLINKGFVVYSNTGTDFNKAFTYLGDQFSFNTIPSDINQDNKQDVTFLTTTTNTTSGYVFTNTGSGSFDKIKLKQTGYNGVNYFYVVEDLNNDNKKELINIGLTFFPFQVGISIFTSSLTGTYNFNKFVAEVSGASISEFYVRDLNGDNLPEIIVSDPNTFQVIVYKNLGNLNFDSPGAYQFGSQFYDLAFGDLNGDNKDEIIINYTSESKFEILFNDGNGIFPSTQDYSLNNIGNTCRVYDMNQDGRNDVVINDNFGINLFLNQGGGSFNGSIFFNIGNTYSMVVSDFFAPNKPAIVVGHSSNFDNQNFSVLTNFTITGNGTQTIKPFSNFSVPYSAQSLTFNTTVSSGLSVSYISSNPGILQVSGSTGDLKSVGIVTITAYSLGGNGYGPVSTTGVITVTKANLKVIANNVSGIYGSVFTAFTSSVSGLIGSDIISVSYSCSATSTTGVGMYPISLSLSGADLYKYNYSTVGGNFTVIQAPATVKGNNFTRKYGEPNPAFTASVSGLLFNEVPAFSYQNSASSLTGIGNYPIIPSISGVFLSNYSVTIQNGNLSITKANLTVTALNAIKNPGTPDPQFTSTVAGLVNGDQVDVTYLLSGFSEGRAVITPVVSGVALNNYDLVTISGTLSLYAKISQFITFNKLSDLTLNGLNFTLNATASSGLPVTYVLSDDSMAYLNNNQLLPLKVGVGIITAYQSGDDIYEPATPVSQLLKIVAMPSNTLTGINIGSHSLATINAYPNPSDGSFKLESESPFVYKIYNTNGILVNESRSDKYFYEIEGLSSGLYLLISGNERIKLIVK